LPLPLLSVPIVTHLLDLLFSAWYGHHRALHSFPTRRSSDLLGQYRRYDQYHVLGDRLRVRHRQPVHGLCRVQVPLQQGSPREVRSEEHTSELQSRENLVCRLLLDKKKVSADTKPSIQQVYED